MQIDMNERAARPTVELQPPRELPIQLPGPDGQQYETVLHLLSDAELATLAGMFRDPMAGWRWARSLAWLLAGKPPRRWKPD